MRVVTFNLLHGVPLRDQESPKPSAQAKTGPFWRKRSGGAQPSSDSPSHETTPTPNVEESEQESSGSISETIDAAQRVMDGRRLWSPQVPSSAELLRAVHELLEVGPIDVIALQEVDRYQERTGGIDQARLVAEAIGAKYWRFVPSVRGTPGIASEGAAWVAATSADDPHHSHGDPQAEPRRSRRHPQYGIALISRLPVREWHVQRFPPVPISLPLMAPTPSGRPRAIRVPDEPRSAVYAIIQTPHADVTVATAHLSFVPGANTRQLREIRRFLGGLPRPLILMGDFNTPGGIPNLVTGWQQVARTPTYPVSRPRIQFDHIMADGWTAQALEHARSTTQAMALPVSDHCALMAEFPDP